MEKRKTTLTRPNDKELLLTRTFDAPASLVWSAWMDPAKLSLWWGPNGFSLTTHVMEIKPKGAWKFTMHGPDGTDYKNRIVYLEVDEPKKLVYKHSGEEGDEPVNFTVTVHFKELKETTELSMSMKFETAEELNAVITNYAADEGGIQTVDRLAEFVKSRTEGKPEFIVSRMFYALRELVWDAWTKPDLFAQWFGPRGFKSEVKIFDLQPEGILHSCIYNAEGQKMWAKFVYKAVEPPSRLAWLHSFSDEEGNLTRHPMQAEWPLELYTEVNLEDLNGKTRLTLKWVPHNATDAEIKVFRDSLDGLNQGWGGTFEQLEGFLAK